MPTINFIPSNSPRVLATGDIIARNGLVAWEGAFQNGLDPLAQWSTQGTIIYSGTAALLVPPQTVPGPVTAMVANSPTTYTSAASLLGKTTVSVVNPGPGYKFMVGLTTGYVSAPLAASAFMLQLEAGPAPDYYPIASIYQSGDLGDTTTTLRADWKNVLPLKTDQWLAGSLAQFVFDEDALRLVIGRTIAHEFYYGGDRSETIPNLAVKSPTLRMAAVADATQNNVGTMLAIANARMLQIGTSSPRVFAADGRASVSVTAGQTKPIIALRCKPLLNGAASGVRYYPKVWSVFTGNKPFDYATYFGLMSDIGSLTGAVWEDVPQTDARLEIERTATDITLASNAIKYRVGSTRVESATTFLIDRSDVFTDQTAIAINGAGESYVLVIVATNPGAGTESTTLRDIKIAEKL